MELPGFLIDRIIESVQTQMPDGLTLVQVRSTVINFLVTRDLAATVDQVAVFPQISKVGVRNRDGISPRSVAWATWLVVDDAVRMSRRVGLPWPRDVAAKTEAYAQVDGPGIRTWVTDGAGFRVDFPVISLEGVQFVKPTGWRLPFPLAKKYRLPTTGPITAPNNRS
jgi:hypothetical protein